MTRFVKPEDRPLVLAHRGASLEARENTVEAMSLAVVAGADGVELDVRATADEKLVVHHDAAIKRVGLISELSLAELTSRAPHVPTLDQAAAVLGDRLINVEIKAEAGDPQLATVVAGLAGWVVSSGRVDSVMVSSFNLDAVDGFRAAESRTSTGSLISPVGDAFGRIADVGERGHSWILPHWRQLERRGSAFVAAAGEAGLLVGVWTVDDVARLTRLASDGVAAVITNDPSTAVAAYG